MNTYELGKKKTFTCDRLSLRQSNYEAGYSWNCSKDNPSNYEEVYPESRCTPGTTNVLSCFLQPW